MFKYRMGFMTALDGGGGENEGGDKGGDKGGEKDPNVANMTPDQAKEFAMEMLAQKRTANAEAKAYREKSEALETEKATAAQKLADAEKTTTDKLAEANAKIDQLEAEKKANALISTTSSDLIKEGFPADIVEVGLKGMTEENSKEHVVGFKKQFERFKIDPESKPDPFSHRHTQTKPEDRQPAAHSKSSKAIDEMRKNAKPAN